MTQIELLGELRELPAAAEHSPQLARFEDFLVDRGEMPRAEAQTLVGALVASIFEGACNRAGKAMRTHLEAIVQIRATLRVRYAEVIKLFSGPRGSVAELPPHLDEPAFNDLFNQLAQHLEALKGTVEEATDAMDDPEMLADLKEAEAQVKTVRKPRVPDVLTDPRTRPVQQRPGIYEQQRVELDYYREALRDNPEPQLRRAAEASLAAFIARFRLPSGWRVRLRRIPEFGFTLEQITELASRDPNFADRGFEVVIDVPQGAAPWLPVPRVQGVVGGRA
jgi:polyhydroxyalkanoate synthesis regulator phasin